MEIKTEVPTETLDAVKRSRLKEIFRVTSDGLGAVRRGTYEGHDCMTVAELLIFLKGFNGDVKKELESMPEPQPEFGRKEAVK